MLVGLGVTPRLPSRLLPRSEQIGRDDLLDRVSSEWAGWCKRWYATSALSPRTRRSIYYLLVKAGRWLAATHPDITDPGQWTRELAAEWVAAVDRMSVGEWCHGGFDHVFAERLGNPISAQSKDRHLACIRTFFKDCQEWGWIPRRFNPLHAFATPSSVRARMGPNPRVISDEI